MLYLIKMIIKIYKLLWVLFRDMGPVSFEQKTRQGTVGCPAKFDGVRVNNCLI